MQLIYAGTLAVLLGVALHALLPGRALMGSLLLPAVAGAACAVMWAVLTWSGAEQGGAVMWLVSLACAALSAAGLGVALRSRRHRTEQHLLSAAGSAAPARRA